MDVLAKIFTKYTEQRQFIFDEILMSLEKLPPTKQSARQYRLTDGSLAVGVVLGSGFLSNTMVSGLREETKSLHSQISTLNDQKSVLSGKLGSANTFDTQMAGRMVHDALNGKSVVIFRAPNAEDGDVDAVSKLIGQAGGAVTGAAR